MDDRPSIASMPRRVSTATIARRYAALARMSSIGPGGRGGQLGGALHAFGRGIFGQAASASGARSGVGPTAPRAMAH